MEVKKNVCLEDLADVLDSMAECAGRMIEAARMMVGLISSGKLQPCSHGCEDSPCEVVSEPSDTVEQEVKESTPEPCTFEEVRGLMASLSGKGKKAEARVLLEKFGAKRLSEVQEKDYAALAAAAKAVANG